MANQNAVYEQIAWSTMLAQRGECVSYRVSETLTLTDVPAVLTAPQTNSVDTGEAGVLASNRWNILIAPDDLVHPSTGERIVPARGHMIETETGAKFKAQPSDGRELVWRWSSSNETWRRINVEQYQ